MSYQLHLTALDARAEAPCIGRFEWISDDLRTLTAAARACGNCPAAVFAACDKARADRPPTHGAWAGQVYHDGKNLGAPSRLRFCGQCGARLRSGVHGNRLYCGETCLERARAAKRVAREKGAA